MKKLNLAKSSVLQRLHSLGIKREVKSQCLTNPKNYRLHILPYGFRKIDGHLVPCQREMRVCRLIVKSIEDKRLSCSSVAKELEMKKIKNRKGKIYWHNYSVARIYKRWKGKI